MREVACVRVQWPTTVTMYYSVPSVGVTTCKDKAKYRKVVVIPKIL